jgi:hypothetical protein
MSEYIQKIYSKIRPELLIHQVIRAEAFSDANFRIDSIDNDKLLQVALLKLQSNQTFKPHRHIYKNFTKYDYISNEAWVVVHGSVRADYYDIEGNNIIDSKKLYIGDMTISLENGGHNYTSLENNTLIYEIKIGPYKGVEWDKVQI